MSQENTQHRNSDRRLLEESDPGWQALTLRARYGTELAACEFSLPVDALNHVPQEALEALFKAQRELLAELQRLRDQDRQLRGALSEALEAMVHRPVDSHLFLLAIAHARRVLGEEEESDG